MDAVISKTSEYFVTNFSKIDASFQDEFKKSNIEELKIRNVFFIYYNICLKRAPLADTHSHKYIYLLHYNKLLNYQFIKALWDDN